MRSSTPRDRVVGEDRHHCCPQSEALPQATGDVVLTAAFPRAELTGGRDPALARVEAELNRMRERHDYLGDVLRPEIVRGDDSCKGIDGAVDVDGATVWLEAVGEEGVVIAEPSGELVGLELAAEALEHSSLALQDSGVVRSGHFAPARRT